ncbi:lysine N(6)-hydroxylase/L-ornithine N(5)-oxygenase family protein [Paraliomyxa miuraensis]|uniref:lysine N(6)-hydroxylase/L-ornithine N(5)-oxygenase family protein n=1 Tax=Paraliomyxa miuraensis TaxID=376150 RepID=UPI0022559E8E|nr:SidA/IucD/PvdA family monooxygenase [Paraliomyxa miuraensis]MCX4239970.1 SidA/IucD/PvdA family monooxygenase [Paraliomyxa miuraensis]
MDHFTLAGVGIGPSNLSLAALLDGIDEVHAAFFDRRPRFQWHPGLMFPSARMQTSFLKDLVTAVDPTNPHSFLNYLVRHGRFYPFLAREQACVGRREFADYMEWVARRLPTLRFGADVGEVRLGARGFELWGEEGRLCVAEHVCVGTGRTPAVPECTRPFLGPRCFHAQGILERELSVAGRSVVVIGGGQTGAEVLLELLQGRWGDPARVSWASRRLNFEPLDESPFTNHLFTPAYVRLFHGLPPSTRAALLEHQRLAGDGISLATLQALHDVVYELHATGRAQLVELLPGRELQGMRPGFELDLRCRLDGAHERLHADVVVLCTGLDDRLPRCLEGLSERLALADGHLEVGPDFAVAWDGPRHHRLFAVNAGRHSLGIAESQLSLAAWRSATIINEVLGRPHFDTEATSLVRWPVAANGPTTRAPACSRREAGRP